MLNIINLFHDPIIGFRRKIAQPLSKIVLTIFVLVGIVGVFSPYSYNMLPVGPVVEVIFIALSLILILPLNRTMVFFYGISLLYILLTTMEALFVFKVNIADYLQAYKAFFYVMLLAPFVRSDIFSLRQIKFLFHVMLIIFLIKYTYSRVLNLESLVGSRPGVYVENNFELVFLLLLFYLVLSALKNKFSCSLLILFIVALSASRSSYFCCIVVMFFSLFKMQSGNYVKKIIIILLLGLVGWGISIDRAEVTPSGINIISKPNSNIELSSSVDAVEPASVESASVEPASVEPASVESASVESASVESASVESASVESASVESASVESTQPVALSEKIDLSFNAHKHYGFIDSLLRKGQGIDRVRFLMLFLDETHDWKWYNYFIGTRALTPLSSETCSALAYWDDLYSHAENGKCYSVILHSYILRVIYDHGIIGLIFLITFSITALYENSYKWKDILCVVSVVLISSLSVSAFNSIFYTFALMLYLGMRKENH